MKGIDPTEHDILILPLPTSINRTYRTGNGRYFKSKEARAWEDEAYYALYTAKYRTRHKLIEKNKVLLTLVFYFAKDRDIDGGIKILLDFLQNKVYRNDSQITQLVVEKKVDKDKPRVEIELAELQG